MCFRYELDVLELDSSEGLRAVRFRLGMHCDGCTVTVALLRMHCDGGIVTVALLRWHCHGSMGEALLRALSESHAHQEVRGDCSLSLSLPLARALPPSNTT